MNPWDADSKLTRDIAREVVESLWPQLAPVEFAWVRRGWDHDVFCSTADWIFRFPRRAEIAEGTFREITVLAAVAKVLHPHGIAVPRFEKVAGPSALFPYPFVGYPLVRGVAADTVPSQRAASDGSAAVLGAALSALHAMKPPAQAGLAPAGQPGGVTERLTHVVNNAHRIRAVLPEGLAPRCESLLSGDVAVPPPYAGPPRFLHNDVCPDHLLVEPETGRPIGLIDFDDASTGDPVLDFVGLYLWAGASFVRRVTDHYTIATDTGFAERLTFLARVSSLSWLHEAARRGDATDVAKHQQWVGHAFATPEG